MAEAAVAQPAWVLLAYLIAGVCFILALRGLSGPESSRRGNRTGMLGMAIAVITTLIVSYRPPQICVTAPNNDPGYYARCAAAQGNELNLVLIAVAIIIGCAI